MSGKSYSLKDRKIILGITGSISAYKAAYLLRLLIKEGAEVQVVMTESSKEFIGALSLSTLSNKPVLTSLSQDQQWSQHVHLGLWADLMVIAPASAHTLSKMANGLVDNLLTAIYLSAKCPVMIAPAMDLDMWQHPSTQANIQKLQAYGNQIIPVGDGELASGLLGPGRLAEPEEILVHIEDFFKCSQSLAGKTILITAGPTYEALDPVRYLGNYSSGKMGIRLAEEALKMGATVHLIVGPTKEELPDNPKLNIIPVKSAEDMYQAADHHMLKTDIFILAAAVADFKPEITALQKIKKKDSSEIILKLIPTKDIALHIGNNKSKHQFLCGFALETEKLLENAKIKLISKNMDLIVLNSPNDPGAAFNHDTNKIMILDNSEKLVSFDLKSKKEVAIHILEAIIERI